MIRLGQEARDTTTGFVGIVTERHEYAYSRTQLLLVAPEDEFYKGARRVAFEHQCEVIEGDSK